MSDENKTPPKRPRKRPPKQEAKVAVESEVVSEEKASEKNQPTAVKKTVRTRKKIEPDVATPPKPPARKRSTASVKKPHGHIGRAKPANSGRKKTLPERIAVARELVKKRFYVDFNPELFCKILEGLMTIDKEKNRFYTLAEVLSQDDMPSRVSFYRWLDADETGELLKAYQAVSLACVDDMADEMIRVSYDAQLDAYIDPKTGMWDWHKLSVARSKLITDNLKWVMERKAPAKWSSRVAIDVTSDVSEESLVALAEIGTKAREMAKAKAEAHANELLLDEESE